MAPSSDASTFDDDVVSAAARSHERAVGVIPSGDLAIDAIAAPTKWGAATGAGATVTYSFPEAGSVWIDGYPEPRNGFQPLSAGQQAAVRQALAQWEAVGNIDFVEVTESTTVQGDLRFGVSDLPATADSRYPGNYAAAGDVWLGTTDHRPDADLGAEQQRYAPGSYAFYVLVHEIGHAIGAKHPHEALDLGAVLPAAQDWRGASVMSYRDAPSDPLDNGASSNVFPAGPMELDVDWMRSVYGASARSNLGDSLYQLQAEKPVLDTIVDDSGIDTLDTSALRSAVRLDLDGGWQEVGPAYRWDQGSLASTLFIYGDSTIENARGGNGSDRILGNDKANVLIGNAGDDRLAGRGGSDRLEGGSGDDTYVMDGDRGVDRIVDPAGLDRLELADGFSFDALRFTSEGQDLHISAAAPTAALDLILEDQLLGSPAIDQLLFAADRTLFAWNGNAFSPMPVGSAAPTESADLLILTDGADTAYALGGDDVVYGKAGNDLIDGGNGRDLLVGGLGDDQLVGGNREDKLDGGDGADQLFGGAGTDILRGGQGDDTIQAGDSADIVFGAPGDDTIYGGDGDDTNLVGGLDADTVYGGAGRDSVDGASGNDVLDGGEDDDLVVGGTGHDDLGGSSGDDTLRGGFGDDQLEGGEGADSLSGGFGNDLLLGGDGIDTALFNGTVAGYQFRELANGDTEIRHLPVAGTWYGIDQLSQVEFVKFGNTAPVAL